MIAVVAALLAGACNADPGSTDPDPTPEAERGLHANSPVRVNSVGSVVVGMTLDQISAAAGVALNRQPDFDQAVEEDNCAYVSPATIPGYVPPADSENRSPLAFMIVDGELARIDVLGGDFATEEGVKVGSPEPDVFAAYDPGNTPEPRAFIGEPYRHLTAIPRDSADREMKMVFASDGARVARYWVGRTPHVDYKNGCQP